MKTPYFMCSDEWMTNYPSKFHETRDEAEYDGKQTAYSRQSGSAYVFELVSIINPPGPEPEVVQA